MHEANPQTPTTTILFKSEHIAFNYYTPSNLIIRVYPGADGQWQIYHDDGASHAYLKGESSLTSFSWDDRAKKLTITPAVSPSHRLPYHGSLKVELIGGKESKSVELHGEPVSIDF